MRWLTACFTDLDVGRADTLTIGQVIGCIIDHQDCGRIPPASMMVRSGRGLWLFWILHDGGGRAVRAWPESIDAYCRIQRELGERLVYLEADAAARDVSRITRIPGSVHRGTGQRVAYWFQAGADGRGFSYTLENLCHTLGVHARKIHPAVRGACDAALSKRGRKGFAGRLNLALLQFETLRTLRGGFSEGQRGRACLIYASLLQAVRHMQPADIRDEVRQLAAECIPPYPQHEADTCARSPIDISNMRNQTLADWLQVTPTEAELLETWPAASRFTRAGEIDGSGLELLPRADRADCRRRLIQDHVRRSGGHPPTLEAMREQLAALGIHVTLTTIRKDLLALQIPNPRRHHRADADQLDLLPP